MSRGNGQTDKKWNPQQLGDHSELFEDIVKALSLTMDLVEQASHEHAQRVASIAVNLAKQLNFPHSALRNLYYAGLLHDIGQIGTPDEILRKKGSLTLREKSLIYGHPLVGFEIVREIPTLDSTAFLIRWHHERWDGLGYPDWFRWEETPEPAFLLSISDAMDALVSPRPWRPALPKDEAIAEIRKFSGIQFHPNHVQILMRLVAEKGIEGLCEPDDEIKAILKAETEKHGQYSKLTGNRILGIVDLFSRIIDARHRYSRGHSRRVANLAKEIGRELGYDDEQLFRLEIAGLLHEAGKVAISSAIVEKAGKLDDRERETMRQYPLVSERIVSSIRSLSDLGPVVRHIHEHFDGSGYPDGLRGEEIPIFSRILAVSDSYDAMASKRPYRNALPLDHIIREMRKDFGTGRLDPGLAGVEDIIIREAKESSE